MVENHGICIFFRKIFENHGKTAAGNIKSILEDILRDFHLASPTAKQSGSVSFKPITFLLDVNHGNLWNFLRFLRKMSLNLAE